MNKAKKNAQILMVLALIANIVIFIQEVRYFAENLGNLKGAVVFFTFDSNIYAGIVSFIMAFDLIECLIAKRRTAHRGVLILKYTAACAVMVTFLTVACYLGPVVHLKNLFKGSQLYAHLLVPIEAFLSLILLERGARLKLWHAFFGLIPVLTYGIFYIYFVLNHVWTDHYHMMLTDPWILSIGIVAAAFFLLSMVVAGVYMVVEKVAGK